MKIRNRIILIVVLAAAVLVAVRIRSISHSSQRLEAEETRLLLEAMADQDVDSIQDEIDLRRSVVEAELAETREGSAGNSGVSTGQSGSGEDRYYVELMSLEELQHLDYQAIFNDAVVMGDSILGSLYSSDILSSDQYLMSSGVSSEQTVSLIYSAAYQNPDVLFLTFGLDDMDIYGGDSASFRAAYDTLLYEVQDLLPYTQIYAVLILPVQDLAAGTDPAYAYRDEYNLAIESCCEGHGIPCMNLDYTFLDEYYASDGVHPLVYFYYGWLYSMAKGAGLI